MSVISGNEQVLVLKLKADPKRSSLRDRVGKDCGLPAERAEKPTVDQLSMVFLPKPVQFTCSLLHLAGMAHGFCKYQVLSFKSPQENHNQLLAPKLLTCRSRIAEFYATTNELGSR